MSQSGSYFGGGSPLPDIETITGDTGGPVGPDGAFNINVLGGENINTAGNPGTNTLAINLNEVIRWPDTDATGTTGVIYLGATGGVGGTKFMHNFSNSTYLGTNAGSFINVPGALNVGIGGSALAVATDVATSVAIGHGSQDNNSTSDNNVSVGTFSLGALTSGAGNNTVMGTLAGTNLLTGAYNILIGSSMIGGNAAGINYTTSESDNICISNSGVTGESNVLRLGAHGTGLGQQNRNFTAGIRGITPAVAGAQLTVIDSSHQLGSIANGTTGQLVTITTGANPVWASSSNGDFTFTSSTAGTPRILTVTNTDNTNTGSHATAQLTSGGASGGDPVSTYTVTGAQSFTTGIDNSDSDAFKISASTALGTTDTFIMTPAGERTMPLQPAFLAYNSADDTNVTGDGTAYTIIFDTEIFDQNGDYNNATGVFTAPVTGRYQFDAWARISNIGASHTAGTLSLVTSATLTWGSAFNPAAIRDANLTTSWGISKTLSLTAGDTVSVASLIFFSTKTITVTGQSSATRYTHFSGFLVC